MRFKRISLSCRISLCLVSVCFELLKVRNRVLDNGQCSYSMYGTIFYYHSIVCSLTNIIASAFALLFNLGPLSVSRANNRKNLMPTIPDLSEGTFNYIMSVTSFEKSIFGHNYQFRSSCYSYQFYSISIEDRQKGIQLAHAKAV